MSTIVLKCQQLKKTLIAKCQQLVNNIMARSAISKALVKSSPPLAAEEVWTAAEERSPTPLIDRRIDAFCRRISRHGPLVSSCGTCTYCQVYYHSERWFKPMIFHMCERNRVKETIPQIVGGTAWKIWNITLFSNFSLPSSRFVEIQALPFSW